MQVGPGAQCALSEKLPKKRTHSLNSATPAAQCVHIKFYDNYHQ